MKVYVDLDDTLCSLIGYWEAHGVNYECWEEGDKFLSENPDCFAHFEPTSLLEHFKSFPEIWIISQIPSHFEGDIERSTIAKQAKTKWVEKHIGCDTALLRTKFVFRGEDKAQYAVDKDGINILYDDRQENIDAWIKAGGIGFLVQENL